MVVDYFFEADSGWSSIIASTLSLKCNSFNSGGGSTKGWRWRMTGLMKSSPR